MDITKETQEFAAKVADDNNLPTVFVNERQEVFTDKSLAFNSVGGDASKVKPVFVGPATKAVAEVTVDAAGSIYVEPILPTENEVVEAVEAAKTESEDAAEAESPEEPAVTEPATKAAPKKTGTTKAK